MSVRIKNKKNKQIFQRRKRVRSKIHGTAARPRLSVHRSLRFINVQLIDDKKGHTIASVREVLLFKGKKKTGTKVERAHLIGEAIGKKAHELGISKAVFDRSSYKYHGRVKAVAEGARQNGLKF